jgi:hypothetical protein
MVLRVAILLQLRPEVHQVLLAERILDVLVLLP